jgi:hypothetical protein
VDGFLFSYSGFDPDAEGLREALTSTGNGYLCTRGAVEWESANGVHYPGTYVHGGCNRETTILSGLPVLNEDLVNLPNCLVLQLRIDGEDVLRLADVELLDYRHALDIRTATVRRYVRFREIAVAGRRRCRAGGLSAWRIRTTPVWNGFSLRRIGRGLWRSSLRLTVGLGTLVLPATGSWKGAT